MFTYLCLYQKEFMGRENKYKTDEERKNAKKESVKKWQQKNREVLKQKRMYHYEKNKEYYSIVNRENYLKNRKKIIDRCSKWNLENQDKIKSCRERQKTNHSFKKLARRANGCHEDKISALDIFKLAKKQRLRCALTGDKITRQNISLDHIIPSSKGGKNVVKNLRLVTVEANFLKRTYSDKELFKICKKVVSILGELK